MKEKDFESLVAWALSCDKEDFLCFIQDMQRKYINKEKIVMKYKGKDEDGKIFYWLIRYNVRFPDFDLTLCINDIKNGIVLKFLTMENFFRIEDGKYKILDMQGEELLIEC